MSIIFTRHDKGQTGAERNETAMQPRQTALEPVKTPDMTNILAAQPKTIADFIKTYGQSEWKKFRATILATPSTVTYLQASDAYAKAAMNALLLRTEVEIAKRVIEFWEQQLASQKKSTQDGLGFIAEQWAKLDNATQRFMSAFTQAFVGTPEQMKEQMQGVTVTFVPKLLKKANQNVQSPIGPIPVGEMNDPVGKIAYPDIAKFWITSSSSDLSKAIGQTLSSAWPIKPTQSMDFLIWAAKQTSTLFRKDVADRWFDEGMPAALANFGNAIQSRVNLLNNMAGIPQAIENNKKILANVDAKELAAADKAVADAQAVALEALKKVGSGVPTECATATAAVNFEFTMALALMTAQSKLNESVIAGLTQSANLLAQMEELQQKLLKAQSKAEKELIAAQIVAISGKGAADLSRVGKRLNDRKGKIADAGERADKAVAIADAHGLDGQAARQAAQTIANQRKAATELNVAHEKTKEAEAGEIVRILKEVEADMGQHAAGAAGEIVAALQGGGGGSGDGGSGALWLIAAAVGAKFLLF